ncbi:hypothetical protein CEB3_c19090 [Peptococcaceae bacterium CEB3]|nr:hypothetical protein CEB3_c19090 [Peptococcaceae bacterium CEB3]
MDEAEICCSCGAEFTWEEVKAKGQPADVEGMLNFLERQTGESFEDWNITEAYFHECACGRGFVVAEVPDACNPDENGDTAPAYLTLGLHGKAEKTERFLPLRIQKQADKEVLLKRDTLRLV